MIDYGFTKELNKDFEQIVNEVIDKVKQAGFGVLTTIDLKEKFKEKLGIDFKKYLILGVCNPPSAHKAIEAEENIGLMLPCNVIVYEKNDHVVVSAIKPTVAMQTIDNQELKTIAEDIETKLKNFIESI
ncbi:MAG: DUF302 domain-containing protein [Sedimentisphaerales bacterium]